MTARNPIDAVLHSEASLIRRLSGLLFAVRKIRRGPKPCNDVAREPIDTIWSGPQVRSIGVVDC